MPRRKRLPRAFYRRETTHVARELLNKVLAMPDGRGSEAGPHAAAAWERLRSETWLADQEHARYRRLRELAGGQG